MTQQEHSALCAVTDWKPVYEVVALLYPNGANHQMRRKIRQALDRLTRRGLVEHHGGNDTYRATAAGREFQLTGSARGLGSEPKTRDQLQSD